jgi:Ca2+-binding RTX toxin-like protein
MIVVTTSSPLQVWNTSGPHDTILITPEAKATELLTNFPDTLLVNYGTVEAGGVDAFVMFAGASPSSLVNKLGASAVGSSGVDLLGSGSILNEGLIVGSAANGVSLGGSGSRSIANSGDIFGAVAGIRATGIAGFNLSIINSGEIHGDIYGMWLTGGIGGASPAIVSTGTIEGKLDSLLAEGGDRLNVINSGLLSGNVVATSAGQSDHVVNNGTIRGNVNLGPGNDSFSGIGAVSGSVSGEGGNDRLSGGASVDRLIGALGNDTLLGNAGGDLLNGGDGNDSIFGGAGADMLAGGSGQDTLRGGDGGDLVIAGEGDDHLGGGRGIDTLTGGAGADFFIFDTAPNSLTSRDTVTDFNQAADTFQLAHGVFAKLGSHIGAVNPSFFFAGKAAHDANDHII